MQIKAVTVNANNTTAVKSIQRNNTVAQANNNMFAPQCKVTISKEGKKLSSQQAQKPQRSSQSTAAQRMLLRQCEENDQSEKTIDEYREQLKDIENQITSLNKAYGKEATRDIIDKEQKIRRAMRNQKQTQLEENQRCTKEVQELAAMQSMKSLDDIDGRNRELWTLLKTLEEADKAEEEREGSDAEDNSDSAAPEAENSAGDTIHNSATQFAAASMRRVMNADEGIGWLEDEGYRLVNIANTITNDILTAVGNATAALDNENYTNDMRAKLVDGLQSELERNYKYVERNRNNGMHMLQTMRDYGIQRIADNPLAGMQEAKDSMMMSAVNAVLGEAIQSHFNAESKELADEVKKLLDERNSVDRTQEKKEEEEKAEKAEDSKELTNTETQTKEEEDEQAETLEERIQMQE